MSTLRMLLPGAAEVGELGRSPAAADTVQALADLYAYPTAVPVGGWVRASMVSTLDGSASGPDGSPGGLGEAGGLGGEAGRVVSEMLRGLADVIVVGAGTARTDGYPRPTARPEFADRRAAAGQSPAPVLAVVTRSGRLPRQPGLFDQGTDTLVLTCAAADVDGLRSRLGERRVIVAGEDDVDPAVATAQLAARSLRRILLEGGPSLLGRFESAHRVDELCLGLVPALLAGGGPRIAHSPRSGGPQRMRLAHLVECEGLLLGRWLVRTS